MTFTSPNEPVNERAWPSSRILTSVRSLGTSAGSSFSQKCLEPPTSQTLSEVNSGMVSRNKPPRLLRKYSDEECTIRSQSGTFFSTVSSVMKGAFLRCSWLGCARQAAVLAGSWMMRLSIGAAGGRRRRRKPTGSAAAWKNQATTV